MPPELLLSIAGVYGATLEALVPPPLRLLLMLFPLLLVVAPGPWIPALLPPLLLIPLHSLTMSQPLLQHWVPLGVDWLFVWQRLARAA